MFEPFVPLMLPTDVDAFSIAKANVRGVLDSYHGDWDFLIEMNQNAVDALDLKFNKPSKPGGEKPEIEIVINERAGTVRVSDNGVGMDSNAARCALYPNYTDKPYSRAEPGKRSLRGHKGVGLTFLAFGFNLLRYCSKKDNQFFSGEMSGGRLWVDSEATTELPKVIPSEYCPEFLEGHHSGSSFEVMLSPEFFGRVGLAWLGWHYVIRCITAVGYCDINKLFTWNEDAIVTLKVIDMNGGIAMPPDGYSDQLPLEFFYPHNVLKSCNLDGYFKKYPDRTEPPKSEKGKYEAMFISWDTDRIESAIFNKGEIDDRQSSRYAQYQFTRRHFPSIYAMFTHSQRVWRDRLDQGYSNDRRRRFWRPGIQVVTQQMPTGQIQEVSLPFRAGNKDRFFMLVEIPDAKPDYGRKGFKGDISSYTQFMASELILGYFMNNRILLKPTSVAHGPTIVDAEAEADQRISEVLDLPNLGTPVLCFKKEPQYENDVIGLFAELLARDHIRGFEILSVSSGSQYDGVVNYRFTLNRDRLLYHPTNNPLGIPRTRIAKTDLLSKNLEFKRSLIDLINDFDEEIKSPQKVRFVVTWDEGHTTGSGYEIINLLEDDNYELRSFHGETHQLVLEGATIPVIMLQYVIKLLVK